MQKRHAGWAARMALLGGALVLLGVIFRWVLVQNWQDNAYLWFATAGMGLLVVGPIFGVAALLAPFRVSRWISGLGIALLWILTLVSAVIVLPFAVMALFQSPISAARSPLFFGHLIGLVLLIALAALSLRLNRDSP